MPELQRNGIGVGEAKTDPLPGSSAATRQSG
jgi:hypothetical protein